MKWYKRDPDAALSGMAELSFEQRGAYNSLLDLLYSRDGNVPDDDCFCARVFHCDPRTWRRLKKGLMAAGKVRSVDGLLTANRVALELNSAATRIATMTKLGLKSAATRTATTTKLRLNSGPTRTATTTEVGLELFEKRKKNNGHTPTAPLVTTTSTSRDLSVGEDRVCLERRDPPLLRDPPLPPKNGSPHSLASAPEGALAHSADEMRYPPRYKSDNVLQPLPERLNGGW